MSDILSQFSQTVNTRTLTRLQRVMDTYDLTRSEVSRLLGVSRSLVTRWFANHKRCPDNAPELLRAMLEIHSPATIKDMKRPTKV